MKSKSNNILKITLFLTLVLIWSYLIIHYSLITYIVRPRKAAQLILSFHPYDDFIFIIIQIVQVLSGGLIPGALTEFIGGYLYGPVIGTIYSVIGMGIGSLLAFGLARTYGITLVRRIVQPVIFEKYDHFMEERGILVTLFMFLIPGFPKSALCYIIGLSRMNIWIFALISTIGRVFGTVLATVSGNLARTDQIMVFMIVMAALMILLVIAFFYRGYFLNLLRKDKKT